MNEMFDSRPKLPEQAAPEDPWHLDEQKKATMMQVIAETFSNSSPRSAPSTRMNAEKPLSLTETALIIEYDSPTRELLSDIVRGGLNYRVLEAAGTAEARYLTAVEGKIRLLLTASLSEEYLEFARWFLTVHPESTVLVADESLWEITGGTETCEQVLVAKSYTSDELVSTLRRLLVEQRKSRSR
jgi:hypothetical protein